MFQWRRVHVGEAELASVDGATEDHDREQPDLGPPSKRAIERLPRGFPFLRPGPERPEREHRQRQIRQRQAISLEKLFCRRALYSGAPKTTAR